MYVGVLVLILALPLRWIDDARSARSRWGDTTTVVVAAAPAPAGEPIRTAEPELLELPRVAIVDDALMTLPGPDDPLRLSLRPGEVVTRRHVLLGGGHGLASDERAVAVPTGNSTPPLAAGDVVDLVLVVDLYGGADGDDSARTIPARIIDPGDGREAVIAAVEVGDTGPLARALARGEIVIALR